MQKSKEYQTNWDHQLKNLKASETWSTSISSRVFNKIRMISKTTAIYTALRMTKKVRKTISINHTLLFNFWLRLRTKWKMLHRINLKNIWSSSLKVIKILITILMANTDRFSKRNRCWDIQLRITNKILERVFQEWELLTLWILYSQCKVLEILISSQIKLIVHKELIIT